MTPNADMPDQAGGSLLAALLRVARHHGRAVSAEAVMAGLPLEGTALPPALLTRAAERADLVAQGIERTLDDIPALVLPVILLLKNGRALVLLANEPDSAEVVVAAPEGFERTELPLPRALLASAYSGTCFFLKPASGVAERAGLREEKSAHWFWDTLRRFGSHYLYIALAAFLINLLALSFPFFTMNVFDRVLPNGAVASLVALSIGVLLAFAFDAALRMVRSRMIDLTGKQIDMSLASRLFAHVLGLKMAHRPRSAGVLANQIRDFESVREFFTSGTVIAATDLVFAFIFLAFMAGIVGSLALVPVVLLPVSIGIGVLIQRPLDAAVREVQAESAARHGVLVESIGALETLRALGAEGRAQMHWERSVAASARASEAVHHWSSLSLTLSLAAQNLASLIILMWGVFMVLNAEISMGALVAANMLSGRILAPVASIASLMMRGSRTLQALRAIDAVMALPVERPPEKTFVARKVQQGALRFEDVTFRYPEAVADALTQVSFSVTAGERVGIVGRIGSGKTTVGRLAMGFYEPQDGTVQIDGIDIRQYDPADLRQGLGFVLQDCQLFHGTLRENITLGCLSATDAEVIEAARIAGVEEFAALSPLGYDMPVSEGGRSLSGGQRQSVALARAVIRRPRILFLDEPTSALDLRSEAEFVARLQNLDRSTTLIFSTHRVSLLGMVDRVIVFDKGRIVADGPRESVLAALQGKPRAAGAKRT